MCRAFSCLVLKDTTVIWKAGRDSHETLIDLLPNKRVKYARVEVTPPDIKYPYLHPEADWQLVVDETEPEWFTVKHRKAILTAFDQWKHQIYGNFNYKEALNPVNPLKIKPHKVTKKDIDNLKKWASVENSVGISVENLVRISVGDFVRASIENSVRASIENSVGASIENSVGISVRDSVGISVRDSVGDFVRASIKNSVGASIKNSVGAYIGSLFPQIKKWKYINHKEGEYPYQCCIDLWKRGFIPSYNGKIWRLHCGKKAKIVYELKESK